MRVSREQFLTDSRRIRLFAKYRASGLGLGAAYVRYGKFVKKCLTSN